MLPDEVTQLRRQWAVETPPSDLADRIVLHATQLPQRRPLLVRWRQWLPQPRVAMPGFALAACLMIAVVALDQPKPMAIQYNKPMDQIVEEMIWDNYSY